MLIRLEHRGITYSDTILIWSIEPEVHESIVNFGYIVEVSESPEGPWISLFTDPIYAFG